MSDIKTNVDLSSNKTLETIKIDSFSNAAVVSSEKFGIDASIMKKSYAMIGSFKASDRIKQTVRYIDLAFSLNLSPKVALSLAASGTTNVSYEKYNFKGVNTYFDAHKVIYDTIDTFVRDARNRDFSQALKTFYTDLFQPQAFRKVFKDFASDIMKGADVKGYFNSLRYSNYKVIDINNFGNNFKNVWKNFGSELKESLGSSDFWKKEGLDLLKDILNTKVRAGHRRSYTDSSDSASQNRKGVRYISTNCVLLKTPQLETPKKRSINGTAINSTYINATSLFRSSIPDFMTNMYTAYFCITDSSSIKSKKSLNNKADIKEYQVFSDADLKNPDLNKEIADLSDIDKDYPYAEYNQFYELKNNRMMKFFNYYGGSGNTNAVKGLTRTLTADDSDRNSMFAIRLNGLKIPERRQNVVWIDVPMTKVGIVSTDSSIEHTIDLSIDMDQNLFMMDAMNLLAGDYHTLYEKCVKQKEIALEYLSKRNVSSSFDFNRYMLDFFPALYRTQDNFKLDLIVDINNNYYVANRTSKDETYSLLSHNSYNSSKTSAPLFMPKEMSHPMYISAKQKKPMTSTCFRYIFEDCRCLGQTNSIDFYHDRADKIALTFKFTFRRMNRDYYSSASASSGLSLADLIS